MKNIISQAIIVSGEDKLKFLQGQITVDLKLLDNKDHVISAYCNRQGRVLSVFYIIKNNDDYVLLFLGDTAEIFINNIKKYSVFSKIEFSNILDLTSAVNLEKFITNKVISNILEQKTDYYINNKIPVISKELSAEFLPDNLNLINLDGVSFKKGCFLGQEIIARVYYKGKNKKHLEIIKASDLNSNDSKDAKSILISNNELVLVVQNI